ncbi:MAG: hypothetical protein NT085_02920 [candidate division SR1 bacterium]|nr:hypothetical protein [candidate division SR1 bacterium]
MENYQCTQIIEQAFTGMQSRQEKFVIVRLFDNVKDITLPVGGIQRAYYARIDLIIQKKSDKYVRILYRDKTQELLPFSTIEKQLVAVECLRTNNILPTPQEFLDARSLLNVPGIQHMVGGCG